MYMRICVAAACAATALLFALKPPDQHCSRVVPLYGQPVERRPQALSCPLECSCATVQQGQLQGLLTRLATGRDHFKRFACGMHQDVANMLS